MDLNEKVEQLAQITASLKNEINEMKGRDLSTKVDELVYEHTELKNDINDLRYCLMRQNEKILALLNDQNEKLEETIETAPNLIRNRMTEYSKHFPIASLEHLEALEEKINDRNSQELISIIQQLLAPHGIIKNIINIISSEVIMECNVDGHHNKKRLLNYPKFIDLLFQASYSDGLSQKSFLDDVRRALKMVKNRHNKNLCRYRQLQRQEEQEQNLEQSQEPMPILDFLKTEEMFLGD